MIMESSKLTKSNESKIIVSVLIIASILIVFFDLIFPLTERERLYLGVFDLIVVVILAVDFVVRLKSSKDKSKFILRHLYEFPAMVPLLLTGTAADSSTLLYYVRLIALFRLGRLYNIISYIDGSELIILASMSACSIIFGGFAIYIAEAGKADSSINNLYDALWWSVETITTVAYGEYYPVTFTGRIIASFMMFAAIAFLWTFVGALGSRFIEKRLRKREDIDSARRPAPTVIDETKTMIKNRIDGIETLNEQDLEMLITMIRSLNSKKNKQQ
jgi:voltage-gated potassium channel